MSAADAVLKELSEAVVVGEREKTGEITKKALELNVDVDVIVTTMSDAMKVVGDKFAAGEYFVPEMLMSAYAFKAGFALIQPKLEEKIKAEEAAGGAARVKHKVVIGTVVNDIHDIGKNMVASALSAAGFEVYDLGVDVMLDRFVQEAERVDANIIGMSALLTTTMMNQKYLIDMLKEKGLRDKYKIMIGGAPTNAKFAQEIGADSWSPDAFAAVKKAKELLGVK